MVDNTKPSKKGGTPKKRGKVSKSGFNVDAMSTEEVHNAAKEQFGDFGKELVLRYQECDTEACPEISGRLCNGMYVD